MRLEVRRLVTDHAIRRAVTFVESVTGKFFQQIENGIRLFLGNFVRARAALDKIPAFLGHLLLVLLAHGPPEKIGLRKRVAGKFARSSHHLFLVNHHPVGVGADVLEQRMQIFYRREALFRFHVFRDQLHRAGPVQRDQCDDIVELFDIELLRETGHAAGFHLEQADGFAAVVKREGSGVIQRNIF